MAQRLRTSSPSCVTLLNEEYKEGRETGLLKLGRGAHDPDGTASGASSAAASWRSMGRVGL